MKEVWKDIPGWEGFYKASNMGKIKSVDKYVKYNQGTRHLKEKILKQHINKQGYYSVDLCKNGKPRPYGVHHLVALAFSEICGKPFPSAVVNHKDENKLNNIPENLEWMDKFENLKYGTAKERNKTCSKRTIQYDIFGNYLNSFDSAADAERETGIKQRYIQKCARGYQKQTNGFIWKYA